jgi:hypothetical protein
MIAASAQMEAYLTTQVFDIMVLLTKYGAQIISPRISELASKDTLSIGEIKVRKMTVNKSG